MGSMTAQMPVAQAINEGGFQPDRFKPENVVPGSMPRRIEGPEPSRFSRPSMGGKGMMMPPRPTNPNYQPESNSQPQMSQEQMSEAMQNVARAFGGGV